MMLVHISSLMILLAVAVVSAGTAAPAFIVGHGHGRGAGQCTVTSGSSKGLVPALHSVRTPLPVNTPSSRVRMRALENDDEDDGWGDADDNGGGGSPATTQKGNQPTVNSEERSRVSTEKRSAPEERERDLFIPIFSLVSLAGLFGSYGYEMLRLYSRGELYLPWDRN